MEMGVGEQQTTAVPGEEQGMQVCDPAVGGAEEAGPVGVAPAVSGEGGEMSSGEGGGGGGGGEGVTRALDQRTLDEEDER